MKQLQTLIEQQYEALLNEAILFSYFESFKYLFSLCHYDTMIVYYLYISKSKKENIWQACSWIILEQAVW